MGNCLCRASDVEDDNDSGYHRAVVDVRTKEKDVHPNSPVYSEPPPYQPSEAVPVVVQDDGIYPAEKVENMPAEPTKAHV
ncbi:hypothetical protein FLAG1_05944 [Fusarium langsethiae]|uniref:Uncharacterized protein n=1 Tax=Fusarium langsethiae TaxID=179993 RepID=A0A0N0DEG9_FUSLA|nr:hypothetical protein FLAG1_05944 [Fusarium langsethiae]GKU03548.1 unnamed protein product [Fusarium langsethiae]GKU17595.1 unnamed protein product [Fusarium langsethiae]